MSNTSAPIRAMCPEDLERVHEIYLVAHVDEYAGEKTVFAREGIADSPALIELLEQCEMFLYDDGEVKGFVGSRDERILWLYVHPDHRGQKIGQQLIDFMLARLAGCITISVIKSNKPALNLYLGRGFKVFGDYVFLYQGVPVEVYRMKLQRP